MLSEVDATLISLVRQAIEPGVPVLVGSPDEAGPAVGVRLRSIREDLTARNTGWQDRVDEHGRVVARELPPRRFRFHYLLTAHAPDAVAEHALLGAVLVGFARLGVVPAEHVPTSLRESGLPVGIELAHPDCPLPGCQPGAPPDGGLDVVLIACWSPAPLVDLAPTPDTIMVGAGALPPAPPRPRRTDRPAPRGVISER